jgi:3-isopropylmalate/(R)-2-methylmalate dehydratase small subunit
MHRFAGRFHGTLRSLAVHIKGRAWVFGRNINTDLIYPKMWFRPTYEPGEMASHLMVGIDEEFPKKVKRGDVIVGGHNFGCGSSREEAAAAMKEAGIGAVVAPSFGRIYTRNCINVGLPIVVSPGIDDHVAQGDEIEIDLAEGCIRNLRSGYQARLPPMAPESLRLIQDGGIANYTRRILEERRKGAGSAPV